MASALPPTTVPLADVQPTQEQLRSTLGVLPDEVPRLLRPYVVPTYQWLQTYLRLFQEAFAAWANQMAQRFADTFDADGGKDPVAEMGLFLESDFTMGELQRFLDRWLDYAGQNVPVVLFFQGGSIADAVTRLAREQLDRAMQIAPYVRGATILANRVGLAVTDAVGQVATAVSRVVLVVVLPLIRMAFNWILRWLRLVIVLYVRWVVKVVVWIVKIIAAAVSLRRRKCNITLVPD